jgi:hypothetical protein
MTTRNLPILFLATLGLLATAIAHGADAVTSAPPPGPLSAPDFGEALAKSPGTEPGRETHSPLASKGRLTAPQPPAAETTASGAQADPNSVGHPATRARANESDGGKVAPDPLAAAVIDDAQLAKARGGADTPAPTDLHVNQNNSTGTVAGNVASQLTTGSNNISDGAFSNSSGIPIVIQNSGNNVLIQNSTILNLQLAAPK